MKCEDFLPWRATGEWWSRLCAWRHGLRCARCAAAARELDAWQGMVRTPEPLPRHLRVAWESTGAQDAPVPQPFWTPRFAGMVALAGIATVLVGLQSIRWMNQPEKRESAAVGSNHGPLVFESAPPHFETPPVTLARTSDRARELTSLLRDVDALQADLADTANQAALLDVRRQADVLIAKYGKW